MTDRKKPGVAFWTTVVLVVGLVAYPLSIGPVQCLNSLDLVPYRAQVVLNRVYLPLGLACDAFPSVERGIESYVRLWTKPLRRENKAKRPTV